MSISAQPLSCRMEATRCRSAKENCPGASGRRAGMFGSSRAAARSAVVMNGFSAALRQAMHRSLTSSIAARRRFAKATTGLSKNMTPKREMTMSKLAGSKAWVCASARMKLAGSSSRSARARATAINGSEMSTPVQWPFAPSRRAAASVVLPVPQPTSRTRCADAARTSSTSRSSNGLNSWSSTSCRSTQARPPRPFHSAVCSSLVWCVTSIVFFLDTQSDPDSLLRLTRCRQRGC